MEIVLSTTMNAYRLKFPSLTVGCIWYKLTKEVRKQIRIESHRQLTKLTKCWLYPLVNQQHLHMFSILFYELVCIFTCKVPTSGKEVSDNSFVLNSCCHKAANLRQLEITWRDSLVACGLFSFYSFSFLSFNFTALFLLANMMDSWKVYGACGSVLPWSKPSSASLLRHIGPGLLWSGSVMAPWGREYPVFLNNEAKRWLQKRIGSHQGGWYPVLLLCIFLLLGRFVKSLISLWYS